MKAPWLVIGLMIALAFAGCAARPPPAQAAPREEPAKPAAVDTGPPPIHIHLAKESFDPSAITVPDNTAVTWHAHEGTHDLFVHQDGDAADDYAFSQSFSDGVEVTYVFDGEGATYKVFCKTHSTDMHHGMTMRVSVA